MSYSLFESLLYLLLINEQLPHISCLCNSSLMIILQILGKLGQFSMLLLEFLQPDVLPTDDCIHLRKGILFLEQ